MNKQLSIAISLLLILTGVVALVLSLLGALFAFRIWQLWPLIVVSVGLLMLMPPLFARRRRGLGVLFIFGVPTLATGGILLLASVLRWWSVWSWLWPLEVIAPALGFLFAAITMRAYWMVAPAIVIGANGLLMQFCALTGLWETWAVLWTIEPLAIGLALLILNAHYHKAGLLATGLAFCIVAGLGMIASVGIASLIALSPFWRVWRWIAPAVMVLIGAGLLLWSVARPNALETPRPEERSSLETTS
ncbi:MAG: hypothetical protein ACP5JG_02095 [Anaerolineae bacterium]